MTTLEELRRVPLFKGLTDGELRGALEVGSEEFIQAGEVGGREGEPVDHLYVILEGEFRWSKKVDGGEVVMNTYGSGEFFAEVPLLLGKPFLATWRALADSRVFALPNEIFRRMLTTHPSFSNTVLEMLAQRIQVLYSVSQQRERLSSLGTLAAGLAHELNNPASASRRAAGRLRDSLENRRSLGMRLTRAVATIRGELANLGVRLAIDDFGTGYSSLSALHRFPVEVMKIDRSFVKGLREHPEETVFLSAIIDLARTLEMRTVAEGVETAEQLALLQDRGCDIAQGNYFAEPLPAEGVTRLLVPSLHY